MLEFKRSREAKSPVVSRLMSGIWRCKTPGVKPAAALVGGCDDQSSRRLPG